MIKPTVLMLALAACGDSAAASSDGPDDPALADLVQLHNDVRAEVGTDPLTWSAAAAAVAKAYANECNWGHNPDRQGYGENIYGSSPGSVAADVVSSWADEKKNYDVDTGQCSGGECGHYTQIVWRDTKAVGCAKATCDKNSPFGGGSWDYWVCDYDPPGNYSGQKAY